MEIYEDPLTIENSIDEDNPTIQKIANSIEERPTEVSESVSNLYHAGLLIDCDNGICLGPDGYAEARSRRSRDFERNRGVLMVIVTVALAVSSIIQALGGPEEYGTIGMGLIGVVYITLTFSAYYVSLELINS